MSSLLYALGAWAVRRRRVVAVLWLAGLVVLGIATGLLQRGTSDVFTIPGTQSQRAMDALNARFPEFAGASGQVVVTAPAGTSVTDPPVRSRIEALTSRYAALPHVRGATSPYDEHLRGTVSPDGRTAVISVQLDVNADQVTNPMRAPLEALAQASTTEGLTAAIGGSIFTPTAPQIGIWEGVGVLLALVVLLVTFGSALAAGIPLATSLIGVAASMLLILLATRFTEITSTAPFLALMIGLAVGIDYALFVLSRHRDLLAAGQNPAAAAAEATGTAGSAVVFAGATVAIALVALGVAGVPFLTAMGIAGAVGVGWAVLTSITLLPAILGWAGHRLTPKAAHTHHERRHTGTSARWVRMVTRVPALTVVLVLAGLGAAALPTRDLALALPDNGSSAPSSTQRQAFDTMAEAFGPGANAPLVVTLDIVGSSDPLGVLAQVRTLIEQTPGVASVTVATPNRGADTGVIVAIPTGAASSPQTRAALDGIRALGPQVADRFGVELAVTGHTAAQVDISQRLADALVPFALVVVGLSLVLLTLVFRSILVPVTAALGYLLSVGAAFGAAVAVTEWGWLAGPLGVAKTGPIIAFMPIIVMGVLFGLAMDYQVFLVSSMRARFVHEGDARTAVPRGFTDAARVVVAAALIMVGVFAAFVPHGAAYIKPIALGLAVGVAVDAFVVRLVLIPALMSMLGRAAWWLPGWLDRILPVLDVEGESLHRRLEHARAMREGPGTALQVRALGWRDEDGPVYAVVGLSAEPGSLVLVHGPAGSGKSALLLTLAGRMLPTEGEASVAGRLVPDEASAVRRLAGLAEISGVNDLDPMLSVAEHVDERLVAATWHPWVSAAARDRVLSRWWVLVQHARTAPTVADPQVADPWRTDPAGPPRPGPQTLVRDLDPLTRWCLGVALGLVGRPALLVVDDVDGLRGAAERAGAWAVLADLPRLIQRPELTVLASCRDTAEARAAAGEAVVELALPARTRRSAPAASPPPAGWATGGPPPLQTADDQPELTEKVH